MEYHLFLREVKGQVAVMLGDGFEVELRTVTKNNSVILDGIVIRRGEERVSPTIYLNGYYGEYMRGASIEQITEEIMALYESNNAGIDVDVEFFSSFEKIKDRIVFKLVHYEKNKQLLLQIPHVRFLDMAIVFYYLVCSDELHHASILLHNSHMELWKKEVSELLAIAKQNAQKILEFRINHIEDILREEFGEEFPEEKSEASIPMYVLSNQSKLNGAACMLYPDVLKDFSDKMESDLFLLPSSIHELIVIPQRCGAKPEELRELVRDTNDNHVEAEEILSYSVYQYSRQQDFIQIL